jgi:hypothetical protein
MRVQPFAFVVHQDDHGHWHAWPWEFAYYVQHGETADEAISNARARLERELDRREAVDSQWKFKPHQWPPPLKALHERVQHDAERRALPYEVRTYDDWLTRFPIAITQSLLPRNAVDSEIIDKAKTWADLVCRGLFTDAIEEIPDATRFLPMADFPQPHVTMTADTLRSIIAEAEVEFPIATVISSGPSITRLDEHTTFRDAGQRLVCGLGRVLAVIEMRMELGERRFELDVEMHVFETDKGLLVTLRRAALEHADELR